MNMNDVLDRINTERSFSLVNTFYLACILKQLQGVEWTPEEVRQEVLEERKAMFREL